MDKLTSIQVFTAVAASGSFSTAARELGLSTAMVSKHIKRLEDDLGVRLLNRSTRRSSLTEAGSDFFARCANILRELEDAEQNVKSLSGEVRGELRISAPATFGAQFLMPAIIDFKRDYPRINVNLRLGPQTLNPLEGGYDIAIHAGDASLSDSSLVARKLGSFEMQICASADYVARAGTPQQPRDLAKHNCLIFQSDTATTEWLLRGPDDEEYSVAVSGDMYSNQGNALRIAAVAGMGVIRLPDYLLADDLQAGRLLRLLPDFTSPERAVFALYPHREHLPAKVRSFIDFLASRFDARASIVPEPASHA